MNLKDKREDWEEGGEEVLCITRMDGAYATVYVILNYDGEYTLHRYFPNYGQPEMKWEVSIDVTNSTLERCLKELSEAFQDAYPIN